MLTDKGLHCHAFFKVVFKEASGKTIPVYKLSPDFNEVFF